MKVAENKATLTYSYKTLFIPYIPIILVMIALLVDSLFSLGLRQKLPSSPYQIFMYSLIFGYPHIMASNLIFLDKEYLQFYKSAIIERAIVASIIVFLVYKVSGMNGFYAFFYAWTVVHVTKQQLGIGKMLNRSPSKIYDYWGWGYTLVAILLSAGVGFYGNSLSIPRVQLLNVILFLTVAVVGVSGYLFYKIPKRSGRLYLIANLGLLFLTVYSYYAKLPLFVILAPRIVHDVTAYMFYVAHDTNRNTPTAKNYIYKATSPYLPIWTVCVGLSLMIAYFITTRPGNFALLIGLTLSIMHYITESITWRGGTLHRKYLSFRLD